MAPGKGKGMALHMLSLHYRYAERDVKRAAELEKEAAKTGFSVAVFNLSGRHLEAGLAEIREAYRWASHPSQKDDPIARKTREQCAKILEIAGQSLPPLGND
jgi:hypothetical protein